MLAQMTTVMHCYRSQGHLLVVCRLRLGSGPSPNLQLLCKATQMKLLWPPRFIAPSSSSVPCRPCRSPSLAHPATRACTSSTTITSLPPPYGCQAVPPPPPPPPPRLLMSRRSGRMGAAVATYLQHCSHPDLGLNPRRVCAALTAVTYMRQMTAEIPYEAMSKVP